MTAAGEQNYREPSIQERIDNLLAFFTDLRERSGTKVEVNFVLEELLGVQVDYLRGKNIRDNLRYYETLVLQVKEGEANIP